MPNFRDVAGPDPTSARFRAIEALRDGGVMSRAELARRTALAPSTITAVVKGLTAEGVVIEKSGSTKAGSTARDAARTDLALNPRPGAVVGVDFGFRTVRLLIADLTAQQLARAERRLPDHYTAEDGLTVTHELLDEALADAGLTHADIGAAGVALPGPVNTVEQRVVGSAILPGWYGVSAHEFAERLEIPVVVENDANLAALGEHVFGAGRGSRDSITVKFHSGIGAGIIVAGELVSGSTGGAGEIGHTLVDRRGPLCRCGKRGCLDTYAAVPAALESMSSVHPSLGFRGFIDLIQSGDPGAERVARDAAELVGEALANACLLLAPERIVLVGAMSRAGDVVLDPIRSALDRQSIPDHVAVPDVVLGELGDRHTAMGAVALALRHLGWLPES